MIHLMFHKLSSIDSNEKLEVSLTTMVLVCYSMKSCSLLGSNFVSIVLKVCEIALSMTKSSST